MLALCQTPQPHGTAVPQGNVTPSAPTWHQGEVWAARGTHRVGVGSAGRLSLITPHLRNGRL